MKTIEELENMSFEDLEKIFDDKSSEVPSSLKKKLETATIASSVIDKAIENPSSKSKIWIPVTTILAAAALSSVFCINRLNTPKDTYSDPMEAYLQVEKTLELMSDKMSIGTKQVMLANEIASIPSQTIEKINHNK